MRHSPGYASTLRGRGLGLAAKLRACCSRSAHDRNSLSLKTSLPGRLHNVHNCGRHKPEPRRMGVYPRQDINGFTSCDAVGAPARGETQPRCALARAPTARAKVHLARQPQKNVGAAARRDAQVAATAAAGVVVALAPIAVEIIRWVHAALCDVGAVHGAIRDSNVLLPKFFS